MGRQKIEALMVYSERLVGQQGERLALVTLKLFFLSPQSKPYHHLLAGIRYQNSISTAGWKLRACLHGGGGPHLGEVTCGGSPHLSCKRNQNERICGQAGYPPKRVTSPSWGPPPPCKQALTQQ